MINKCHIYLLGLLLPSVGLAQADSSKESKVPNAFEKMVSEVKSYKVDTAEAPNDKITRKINEIRSIKSGFNINDIILFKLNEEAQKKENSHGSIDSLRQQFTAGDAKRWLNNATVWIYRQMFTYKELKQMLRFYKTGAGKKLTDEYPVLLLKTLVATEQVFGMIQKKK